MQYFLAGGAVRDILIGVPPHEFDIVFDGTPEAFVRLQHAPVHTVGKNKQAYIVNGHEHTPLAGNIEENLTSRDLTINALLMTEDGVIHALPQTFADLSNRIIRHVSPKSFFDDPVRVFRAARFAAVFPDFTIAPETLAHMRSVANKCLLSNIAPERVGNECVKALGGPCPSNFFHALAATNCMAPWFSPLEKAHGIPAGPTKYHGKNSVFDHICEVLTRIAIMPYTQALSGEERKLAAWMGLCHDLGKMKTDPAILPRHIGHEKRGENMAAALAARLRLPMRWELAGRIASKLHMKGGQYEHLRPGTKADLLSTLAQNNLARPFCALIMADTDNATSGQMLLRDMEIFLSVKLPEKWWNMGANSAKKLRELRIKALMHQ